MLFDERLLRKLALTGLQFTFFLIGLLLTSFVVYNWARAKRIGKANNTRQKQKNHNCSAIGSVKSINFSYKIFNNSLKRKIT